MTDQRRHRSVRKRNRQRIAAHVEAVITEARGFGPAPQTCG
jgi:hypothetical protein